MMISSFDDFLKAAGLQPEAQRLLFVIAAKELPDDATDAQKADFEAGFGGALAPVLCVDKLPTELAGFATLQAEAVLMGQPWDIVFAASLPGQPGKAPSSGEAEPHLNRMIESIKQGNIGNLLVFDREGALLRLSV